MGKIIDQFFRHSVALIVLDLSGKSPHDPLVLVTDFSLGPCLNLM
jgi:hypothetical protein